MRNGRLVEGSHCTFFGKQAKLVSEITHAEIFVLRAAHIEQILRSVGKIKAKLKKEMKAKSLKQYRNAEATPPPPPKHDEKTGTFTATHL